MNNFVAPNRSNLANYEIVQRSVALANAAVGNCIEVSCSQSLWKRRIHFGIVIVDNAAWSFSGRLQFQLGNTIVGEIPVSSNYPTLSGINQWNSQFSFRWDRYNDVENWWLDTQNSPPPNNDCMDWSWHYNDGATDYNILAVSFPHSMTISMDKIALCMDKAIITADGGKTGFCRAVLAVESFSLT